MQSLLSKLHFFYRFLFHPRTVGSIIPSSKYLVDALLQPLDWEHIESIVELGAGSGVVTEQILERKKDSCKVIAFEKDPEFSRLLKRKHPDIFHCTDARNMTQALQKINIHQVDAVISCLPFFNFPHDVRLKIIDEIKKVLQPGGMFVCFQYSLQMKPLLLSSFQIDDIRFVPRNIPPAYVYICR